MNIKRFALDDSDETFLIRMKFKVFDTLDFYSLWEYGITLFEFIGNIDEYFDRHQEELPDFMRDGHMFDFIDLNLFQAYLAVRYSADYENYVEDGVTLKPREDNAFIINIEPKHLDYNPDEYYRSDCIFINKYLRRDV